MPKLDIHPREIKRIRNTVSHHLRFYREQKDITLQQISARSGIRHDRLDQMELGHVIPSLSELYVLSEILETGGLLSLVEGI